MDAMTADSGYTIRHLAVDGGLTNSDLLMQIQANIGNAPIKRPKMRETTALGSALAAAHAVGTINIYDFKAATASESSVDCFFPNMTHERREVLRAGWKKAVEKSCGWA
jgi:glycerol kinase